MKLWQSTLSVISLVGVFGTVHAQGPEISLLGVRLMNPITRAFDTYGNPFEITPQAVQTRTSSLLGGGQEGGGMMSSPGRGGGMMGSPGGMGAPPGMGGEGGGMMGGGPGGGTDSQVRVETETLYRYQVKGGYNYLFLANKDGRVIQISAYGLKPNPNIRTKRGITLGDSYKKVVKAYGYPSEHEYAGLVYAVRYNKLNVAFILDAKKHTVIAIIVAAGIPRTPIGFASGAGAGGAQGGAMMGGGGGPSGGGLTGSGQLPPPPGMGGGGGPKGGMGL